MNKCLLLLLFPDGSDSKICACNVGIWVSPWIGKIPWRRGRQPTPVFLPGKSHGQRSLVGYNPNGHKKLDTTEAIEHTRTHAQVLKKLLNWLNLQPRLPKVFLQAISPPRAQIPMPISSLLISTCVFHRTNLSISLLYICSFNSNSSKEPMLP